MTLDHGRKPRIMADLLMGDTVSDETKDAMSDWLKLLLPAFLALAASYTALMISNAEIRAEIRALTEKVRILQDVQREIYQSRFSTRDAERLEREIMVRLEELQRREASQNDFITRRLDALEARSGGPRFDGPLQGR